MKKVVCLFMVILCISLLNFNTMATGLETSLDTGDRDIRFSNGYRGFCLDVKLKGAYAGDTFTPSENTSAATNNNSASDISQMLKVLFTQCFEDVFVSDGNLGYTIGDANTIQAVVWHFSDGQYVWGKQLELVNAVKAYTGPEIPDNGYRLTLDNENVITFYFTVMKAENVSQQDFFAYKIEVGQKAPHNHTFGREWESDKNSHWHGCECGEKAEEAPHKATTADCINPSLCEVCKKELAGTDANNHTGNTVVTGRVEAEEYKAGYTGDTYCEDCDALLEKGETIPATHSHIFGQAWESDENSHWQACECGEKAEEASHKATTADCINPSLCEVCKKELAGTDANNHTGNIVVKGRAEAEEYKAGYTGDTYCEDCDALLEKGETIPATHSHVFGQEWKSDENSHWQACECGEKTAPQKHTYEKRNCIVCGAVDSDYAEMPPNTGDSSNMYLWSMLLLLSMVGCEAMSVLLLRRSKTV